MQLRIVILLICLLFTGCASLPPVNIPTVKKHKCAIRFATYNVYWKNSTKNKHNPHSLVSVIEDINPDILVLQETYCFTEGGLVRHFRRSHPYRLFRHFHRKGYEHEEGMGILSRYPIVRNIYFPPIYGWFPAWLFIVKTPKGYIQVLNVHLYPRLASDNNIGIFGEGLWLTPHFRLQEISYLFSFLDSCLPTIIAGDFNENDNGAAGRYLQNHCYNDLLLSVPKKIKTWHSQFGLLNFKGRYDRIYTTNGLQPLGFQVIQKGYSDHFPVILDFDKPLPAYNRGASGITRP